MKDKKIYENWLATTTWGKLFANYASGNGPNVSESDAGEIDFRQAAKKPI